MGGRSTRHKPLVKGRTVASPNGWTVVIPDWVPTPLNVLMRMHYARRDRVLKGEYSLIWGYSHVAGVPKATGKRLVTQRLTLAGQAKRRDDDGCWKGLLDGLVRAGLLVDDGPDWVEKNPVECERGERLITTIIIEDIIT